jgi:hypothetical protein
MNRAEGGLMVEIRLPLVNASARPEVVKIESVDVVPST